MRRQRPPLECFTFKDVYLVASRAKLAVFRPGEFLRGTDAVIIDPAIRSAVDAPDFVVDEGAFCSSPNFSSNPAHLLCDHLCRAVAFRDLAGIPEERIWLENNGSDYANFCSAAVVPGHQRLVEGACYFFRSLHLLSESTGSARGHPFWFMDQSLYQSVRAPLLSVLGPNANAGSRCLYLSRSDTPRRPLENEDELEQSLAARGFEVLSMSALEPAEQLRAVRDARIVVAPHGGALGNLVVATSGASLIELFNPEKGTACFQGLASAAGVRYSYCFGTPTPGSDEGAWRIYVAKVLSCLLG